MNYYNRHIGDYAKQTAHLSFAEDGAYNRMLDYYYSTELPLPLDRAALYRKVRARSKPEQAMIDSLLTEFFYEATDGWHKRRCDEEIEKYQNKAAANRENGTHGGRPKKPKLNPTITQSVSKENPNETLASSQEPVAKNQEPVAKPREVKTEQSQKRTPGAAPPVVAEPINGEESSPKTKPVWQAYGDAYERRYGTTPVQNATTRAQMAQFCKRIAASEAPEVAAFYVRSNRGFYVQNRHSVGLLLRDAEGLRTEWITGVNGTDTEAKQADRTQALGNAFAPLIAEAQARERLANGTK